MCSGATTARILKISFRERIKLNIRDRPASFVKYSPFWRKLLGVSIKFPVVPCRSCVPSLPL